MFMWEGASRSAVTAGVNRYSHFFLIWRVRDRPIVAPPGSESRSVCVEYFQLKMSCFSVKNNRLQREIAKIFLAPPLAAHISTSYQMYNLTFAQKCLIALF